MSTEDIPGRAKLEPNYEVSHHLHPGSGLELLRCLRVRGQRSSKRPAGVNTEIDYIQVTDRWTCLMVTGDKGWADLQEIIIKELLGSLS